MNGQRVGTTGVLMAVLVAALSGCITPKPPCPSTVIDLDQLVGDYNDNAHKVTTLWAKAHISLTLADDKGRVVSWGSMLGAPNGYLLLDKTTRRAGVPDFALQGKESGRPLFQVGSSTVDDAYYIWYSLGGSSRGGAWYGKIENAGAPGSETLLIDPMGLVSLLGILELPPDYSQVPTVALTMSSDPCAYVVTYIDRQPQTKKILFKREVYFTWANGKMPQPFQVIFVAPDGRRIVKATLKNYKPIPGTGTAGKEATLPTDIEMTEIPWQGRTSHLRNIHLVLSEITTAKGDPQAFAKLWENLPAELKEKAISIDKQAQDGATK